MGSIPAAGEQPHVVCIPYPAQGHINPMFKLAKLLHYRGFHVTFVHSEYNYNRLLKSKGPNYFDGLPDFQYETFPDGLPATDADATQDIQSLCDSTSTKCLEPFRKLLAKLNDSSSENVPPVTCVVADGVMTFTLDATQELGIPNVLLWTAGAGGFLAYRHYRDLTERGLTPLKDESYLINGYLDTTIDWIPGMKDIRLRDFPSFVRTTNPNDFFINYAIHETDNAEKASAVIFNTFDALEHDVLQDLTLKLPKIYTIGPLENLLNQIPENAFNSISSSLWKEEPECLQWLNTKEPCSIVYVNFGSITVMTPQQMVEFAWGLANSKQPFLWIIRPDLVTGESAILPPEFLDEIKERGLLASWCPQVKVLNHPSIGGFLTHNGWNSTIESVSAGVPMVCWPFFADQQTNCWFTCHKWGIGTEIDSNVKREEIEKNVRELMEGEKGKIMKNKAMEWKKKVVEASGVHGSSWLNLDKLVNEVLLPLKKPMKI